MMKNETLMEYGGSNYYTIDESSPFVQMKKYLNIEWRISVENKQIFNNEKINIRRRKSKTSKMVAKLGQEWK